MLNAPNIWGVGQTAPRHPPSEVVASLRMEGPEGSEYRIVATEYYDGRDYLTGLRFSLKQNGQTKELSYYRSDESLLYMLPASANGAILVTVWEGASGVWTRAFLISGTGARIVLERATHLPPEFTLDGILVNAGWVPVGERCCTAEKTEIWTWAGDKYRLEATVPFDKRYEELAKLEHEAKKK